MKVLIVDDSQVIRERLVEILADLEGIEIVAATQGSAEAMESIKKLKPDIVILDIRMPGKDGISTLEAIKRGKNPPKVIMLTNYPYPQYRKRCEEAGADFFFSKSSEFERLIEVLKKLIRTSTKTKQSK